MTTDKNNNELKQGDRVKCLKSGMSLYFKCYKDGQYFFNATPKLAKEDTKYSFDTAIATDSNQNFVKYL